MGQLLQIERENVSPIEQRPDLIVSSLQKYFTTMGEDNLRTIAVFPSHQPIALIGFWEIEESQEAFSSPSPTLTIR